MEKFGELNEFTQRALEIGHEGGVDAGHDAVKLLQQGKAENPKCLITSNMLAIALMTVGRIKEGLKEFENRFGYLQTNNSPVNEMPIRMRNRYNKVPVWDGKSDLKNKTILIIWEGGYGDTIQNIRYLTRLKDKGAKVIYELKNSLCKLIENAPGIDQIKTCSDSSFKTLFLEKVDQTGIDYVISAGSLLYLFDPELNNIPWEFPYLFPKESNSDAVKIVREHPARIKIGIVWAGVHGHGNDFRRSTFKRAFIPLTKIDGVQLFSLQKGEMDRTWEDKSGQLQKINLLEGSENLGDIDLGPMLFDWNDTATVAKELDAVVSVDTSMAHLAGALDVPIWLLLPHKRWAEWRWQRDWYRSQRKINQEIEGDWKTVMERVVKEIYEWKIQKDI